MPDLKWSTIPRPPRPLSTGPRPWKYKPLADAIEKTVDMKKAVKVELNGYPVYRLQATLRANLVKKAIRLRYFQEDSHIIAWAEEMEMEEIP